MSLRMLRLLGLLLFAVSPFTRAAQAPLRIAILSAGANSGSTQAIIRGEFDDAFIPLKQPLLRAPDTHAAWYRLNLVDDWKHQSRPLLVVAGDVRARVTVYLPPTYAAQTLSPYDADLDARFSRHALVLVLPREMRANQPIFLRLGMPGQSQPLQVRIVDYASYQVGDLRHVRLSTLFAAVEAAMLLVILCFWLVLRDRVYLYFVAYMAAQLVYLMAASGELYVLPGARLLAPYGYHPGQLAAILAAALSISFILEFADLPRYVPWLARGLSWMRWPYLLLAIVLWLPPLQPDAWLPNTVNALLMLSTLTALLAAWRAWRRGSRQAGFFLIAWLPLLGLTVLRVVQLIGGLPLPGWLEYGFPASMAYAAVVITVGLADRTLQARRERDHAHRLAEFDALTGVLNRRAITSRLRVAYADARQSGRPFAVLFLDLDHFKHINDSRGHAAGDACLAAVAQAMQAELAELDWLGRYGGEEFLIVLRDTLALGARIVAERIAARVAALRVPVGADPIGLTASIGIAVLDGDTPTPESLVEHADRAQYRAKEEGRNRVVLYAAGMQAGVRPQPQSA